MAPTKEKYPCLVCKAEITGKNVECSFCEKWVHPKCGNISKPHLKILMENKTTYWTCEPCHAVSSKIKKEIRQLQHKQEQMRTEIEEKINANSSEIAG